MECNAKDLPSVFYDVLRNPALIELGKIRTAKSVRDKPANDHADEDKYGQEITHKVVEYCFADQVTFPRELYNSNRIVGNLRCSPGC